MLEARNGDAARWAELADAAGHTLRLSWPAYQPENAAQVRKGLAWLRTHLIVVGNP
jgi:hypothetical protein